MWNMRMELLPEVSWAIPYTLKERFYSSGLNGQVTVREVTEDGDKSFLDRRADLHDYHETFEWGRDSAGAAQLSLALLADALGDDARAQVLHQSFKSRVIIDLPARWTITRSRVLAHARIFERDSSWPMG